MKNYQGLIFAFALILTGCTRNDTQPAGSAATSEQKQATAPANKLCALYTSDEIKNILGAQVDEGQAAGPMATACQWDGKNSGDDAVYAQIQLINDARYWEKHSGAKGYEELRNIGKEAFVATAMGGWEAGTVTDKEVVFVSLNGGTASRDTAVKFLTSTLDRLKLNYK